MLVMPMEDETPLMLAEDSQEQPTAPEPRELPLPELPDPEVVRRHKMTDAMAELEDEIILTTNEMKTRRLPSQWRSSRWYSWTT